MAVGAMFAGVLLCFSAYNAVMTSDKFTYLFGAAAPALSLLLMMVLRLIPNFQRQLIKIINARKCIGKFGGGQTKMENIGNAMQVVSCLTGWALEGAVVAADAMRSRGYGSGRRTRFSIYRFDGRDRILTAAMAGLIASTVAAAAFGGTSAVYIPAVSISKVDDAACLFGLVSYACFLAIPIFLNIKEAVTWRISRSKI
jgi:energy-coupling factor transport system permease protein